MKKNRTIVPLAFLLAILCTLFSSGIIRHDIPQEAYFELAAQPQFDCVGKVKSNSTSASCVLISPRHVLTAAHIFKETETRPDTMEFQGQTVVVYRPVRSWIGDVETYTFSWNGVIRRGTRLSLHPSYTDSTAAHRVDLAIVELATPIASIAPATLNTTATELGAKAVGVGYGAYIIADQPENADTSGRKVAGMNTIDQFSGPSISTPEGPIQTSLVADFDHPDDNSCCNKMGDATPLPLEYATTGGDSGGGLFVQNGQEWQLVGITAQASFDVNELMLHGYYGMTSSWTRIAAYLPWIEAQKR